MEDLTPRQRSILEFIIRFQQEHFMAPTVREIGAQMGLSSPAGIHRILTVLKDKGYLLAEPGKKRSWRFTRDVAGRGLPLLGAIAAGDPLEALQNLEEMLEVSPALFGDGDCFG
ncbi:MAG: MarR family transcriptional regulator, partial [Desulfosarcinaceae bacterium]